jgi:hypothetical protein
MQFRFNQCNRVAQWVRSLDLTAHTSLSPIRRGFVPSFVNYKKGCTWLAVASDKVYQLLAQGRNQKPKYWSENDIHENVYRIQIFVFNATFSNISAISWWPVLVVEEVGVPREKFSDQYFGFWLNFAFFLY